MAPDGLVVLDVHGVVFNKPLVPFLAEVAQRHGRESAQVLDAWSNRVREPFWLGQLGVTEMWSTLLPGADPAALTAELDSRYAPGPLFEALADISGPIWLLSNHRSEWLLPRLQRFGLDGRFERIYVSDAIGLVKPDVEAFRLAQRAAGSRPILYVDDKPANVAAAAEVFERSVDVREMLPLSTPAPSQRQGHTAGAPTSRRLA